MMFGGPFLTDLDERARVKGSRDPLGIQAIWVSFGRRVVGNLTTVSSSVRDFTVTVLGYYFAERVAIEREPGTELATFLRWEQLASYARGEVHEDWGFRGTERARKRVTQREKIRLSPAREHQTLSDQKTYGLWGLYTQPSRASGFLEGQPSRLTHAARELVDGVYMPLLEAGAGREARRIVELVGKDSPLDLDARGHRAVIEAVAAVLDPKLRARELSFYREHLAYACAHDETQGKQRQLSQLLERTLVEPEFQWTRGAVKKLGAAASERSATGLADDLARIETCESVMAASDALFDHMLAMEGKSLDEIASRARDQWAGGLEFVDPSAFRTIHPQIAKIDSDAADRYVAIANALHSGEYAPAVERLVEQNAAVMKARGGAPWVELRAGKLHVAFRDEAGPLPARDAMADAWRFPYFLDSLRSVTATLAEVGRA